jgi:hypothetical protein
MPEVRGLHAYYGKHRSVVAEGQIVSPLGRKGYDSLADGSLKIKRKDDPVRFEIELALQREIRVIPMLVEGAQMQQSADLPESLRSFSRLNGLSIDLTADFDQHMNDRLIPQVNEILVD